MIKSELDIAYAAANARKGAKSLPHCEVNSRLY